MMTTGYLDRGEVWLHDCGMKREREGKNGVARENTDASAREDIQSAIVTLQRDTRVGPKLQPQWPMPKCARENLHVLELFAV